MLWKLSFRPRVSCPAMTLDFNSSTFDYVPIRFTSVGSDKNAPEYSTFAIKHKTIYPWHRTDVERSGDTHSILTIYSLMIWNCSCPPTQFFQWNRLLFNSSLFSVTKLVINNSSILTNGNVRFINRQMPIEGEVGKCCAKMTIKFLCSRRYVTVPWRRRWRLLQWSSTQSQRQCDCTPLQFPPTLKPIKPCDNMPHIIMVFKTRPDRQASVYKRLWRDEIYGRRIVLCCAATTRIRTIEVGWKLNKETWIGSKWKSSREF